MDSDALLSRLRLGLADLRDRLGGGGTPDGDEARFARIVALSDRYRAGYPEVPGIGPRGIRAGLDRLAAEGPVVLVDVRSDDERAVSLLPGAVSRAAYEADRARYAAHQVVAYCTIGARSGVFARQLRAAGVAAWNLDGSVLAWTHDDGPLVTPHGQPTRAVHVFGARWDLAAEGYRAVW